MAAKDYVRDGLTVHWDSEICMHSAVCVRALPKVFDPQRQPWIDIDAAEVEDIVAAVQACPTKALSYTRDGDSAADSPKAAVTVHPQPDGPLLVEGAVSLIDADGNVVRSGERFFLCRCGHSNSKPFCDGSHRKHGFTG